MAAPTSKNNIFLPRLAAGEMLAAISITEPDYGSDVASLSLKASQTDCGWMLNGAKTWCTFAGKADVIVVIARTDTDRSKGHKGLSMFMVEKPRFAGHEFSRIPQADAWWVAQFLQLAIAVCILLTCL